MKRLLTLLLAAVTLTATAKEYRLTSPDGTIAVTVTTTPTLQWSVARGEELLLEPSRLGLEFSAATAPDITPVIRRVRTATVEQQSEVIMPTKFRYPVDRYNELCIEFRGNWALRLRAYNNGVAYRYELNAGGEVEIRREVAEWRFASNGDCYWPHEKNPDYISHCEAFFRRHPLAEIGADYDSYAFLPLYVATPAGTRMVITESDLRDYPCMFLFGDEGNALQAKFPPVVLESRLRVGSDRSEEFTRKAPYIARTSGTRTLPWRILTIDPSDCALLENYLPCQLATPAIEGDHRWVRPGKVAWDWWHDWTISGVDFRAGINTETYKYYIDFAARYGLEYILLDEGWSASTLNISAPREEIDVEELARYGRERGVGVLLWTLWNPLKADLAAILDTYVRWGVSGIKVDFMQRCDQEMVNFYEEVARACYDRRLVVDFHGSFKPAGLQRTYPNVLSFEGVFGLENNKGGEGVTPSHDCVLPFTRMVAGPMDYTPGATRNATAADYRPSWSRPMSRGTRAHQAALYVLYESPVQMLCDAPTDYMEADDFTRFIASVPTLWDEVVALEASAGEYVAVARRHGKQWYIGAITDWTPRNFEVALSFLGEGRYKIETFEDGVNADRVAEDSRARTYIVTNRDTLTLQLAPGGGFAAVLTQQE